MDKIRIDSWAKDLTEEQSWELYYKSRRCHWQEAVKWACKEYELELKPSRTCFYKWLAKMREDEHEHRMFVAAQAAAEAAALGSKVTSDKALINALKSLATEAALETDARTAAALIQSAMSIKDRLQKEEDLKLRTRAQETSEEQLRLAREKFEAAEKRLDAAKGAVKDETLSDEERIAKIKGIFGIS